jgi:hypothetical protein
MPIPDTIAKVLQGMLKQFTNSSSVSRIPGTYPLSTILESESYATASESSWWTATGTEWVTAIEYTTSAGEGHESSTIASFMRKERSVRAPVWRLTALRNVVNPVSQRSLRTQLIEAICNENIDLVINLLDNGVDVSFTDGEQQCPLAYAVRNGNVTVLKLLIEAGANVFVKMAGGIAGADNFAKFKKYDEFVNILFGLRLTYLVNVLECRSYVASLCCRSDKSQSTDRRMSTRVWSKPHVHNQ